MQFLSLSHAKAKLKQGASVLDAAYNSGLSGVGRLHDLFVTIDVMKPSARKRDGVGRVIDYDYTSTLWSDYCGVITSWRLSRVQMARLQSCPGSFQM